MLNKIRYGALKVGAVASASFIALAGFVKAVDPTLVDVATTFTGHVSTILTFVVAVIGAYIGAMLIPLGLKKVWAYAQRIIRKA